jgi:hypothetical protein
MAIKIYEYGDVGNMAPNFRVIIEPDNTLKLMDYCKWIDYLCKQAVGLHVEYLAKNPIPEERKE